MDVRGAHLKAQDLLRTALTASTMDQAWPALRADLEVLPREVLATVAMALVAEARVVVGRRDVEAALRRLEHRVLETMVADL